MQKDLLIMKLLECKDMARSRSRFRTMHVIDEALKVAGYELADILTGKQRIGDKK
jgi:hypothetical protein